MYGDNKFSHIYLTQKQNSTVIYQIKPEQWNDKWKDNIHVYYLDTCMLHTVNSSGMKEKALC